MTRTILAEQDINQLHSCGGPLEWRGCYSRDARFNQYVTPESFAHPAKMSWGLVDMIFKHLKQLGLLQKGDVVCDFMAGSARTGVMSALHGHDFVGVGLEPHFIEMINGNRALLENKIGRKVNWQIIEGDSRKLSEIVTEQAIGIVSPPYADKQVSLENRQDRSAQWIRKTTGQKHIGYTGKGIGIVSPPYQDMHIMKNPSKPFSNIEVRKAERNDKYSSNPQNIGNLKDKALVGITSPPYSGISATSQQTSKNDIERRQKAGIKGAVRTEDGKYMTNSGQRLEKYSDNPENIANLPDKNLVGITSPPYENQIQCGNDFFRKIAEQCNSNRFNRKSFSGYGNYSESNKNLGNQRGESYLQAMFQVYQEAAKVMPIMVTVTKNPTRNGKLRRLDLDTARLLEMAGYRIIDYHRAILFEKRKQSTLAGSSVSHLKGRISFFKRLSLQKGNVTASWEDILICVRRF